LSLFTANCRRNVYLAVSTGICARKATLPRERILAYRRITVLGLCIQNSKSESLSSSIFVQKLPLPQPFYSSLDFVRNYLGEPVKTNLDFLEQETVIGSAIIWAICKSAPRPRQITTPTPHHSVSYRPDVLLAAQQTALKTA